MRMFDDATARWIALHVLPYEPALRRAISRWALPAGLEAEDIVQEVYAKLASRANLDEIASPQGYVVQVARSILLAYARRAKIVPIRLVGSYDEFSLAADDPDPERQASDHQQHQILAQAVEELPGASRSIFTLRVVEGLSYADIGKKMGMTQNAVQKTMARSLAFLADRVGRGGMGRVRASISDQRKAKAGSDERAAFQSDHK